MKQLLLQLQGKFYFMFAIINLFLFRQLGKNTVLLFNKSAPSNRAIASFSVNVYIYVYVYIYMYSPTTCLHHNTVNMYICIYIYIKFLLAEIFAVTGQNPSVGLKLMIWFLGQ